MHVCKAYLLLVLCAPHTKLQESLSSILGQQQGGISCVSNFAAEVIGHVTSR